MVVKHFCFCKSVLIFLSSKVFVKSALLYSLYACVIKLRHDSVISTRLLPIGRLRASQHLLASISKMRSLCVSGLIFGYYPDIGCNSGVIKAVIGKLNNSIQPVILNNIATDFTGAASCISCEERGTIWIIAILPVSFNLAMPFSKNSICPSDFEVSQLQTGRHRPVCILSLHQPLHASNRYRMEDWR